MQLVETETLGHCQCFGSKGAETTGFCFLDGEFWKKRVVLTWGGGMMEETDVLFEDLGTGTA